MRHAYAACEETKRSPYRYRVYISHNTVAVAYGGKIIFLCERGKAPLGNCFYDRP